MALPTKEEFDAWLSLAAEPIQVTASLPADTLTVDDAAAYLRQANIDRRRAWVALGEMPAFQWLSKQREYQRAIERAFPRRRQTTEDATDHFHERAAAIFEHEDRWHALRTSEGFARTMRERDDSLRRRIERRGTTAFNRVWAYDTMQAIAEYLEGQTASRFLDAARDIEVAAQAAQSAIARYLRLAEELNRPRFPDIEVKTLSFRSRFAPTFKVPKILSPIGRKDARSEERLFVYRMFLANRRATRSPKVEAISELMGLEGFRHQYDTRSIERLCARFAEQHRKSLREREPAKEPEKTEPSRRGNIALVRTA